MVLRLAVNMSCNTGEGLVWARIANNYTGPSIMANLERRNPGHEAFVENLHLLLKTPVYDMARDLHSVKLIDDLDYQNATLVSVAPLERNQRLLCALERRIDTTEDNFNEFLNQICKNPTMEDEYSRLKASRGKADGILE